jgi:hypothetical protein
VLIPGSTQRCWSSRYSPCPTAHAVQMQSGWADRYKAKRWAIGLCRAGRMRGAVRGQIAGLFSLARAPTRQVLDGVKLKCSRSARAASVVDTSWSTLYFTAARISGCSCCLSIHDARRVLIAVERRQHDACAVGGVLSVASNLILLRGSMSESDSSQAALRSPSCLDCSHRQRAVCFDSNTKLHGGFGRRYSPSCQWWSC